jgi:hypothetical protein
MRRRDGSWRKPSVEPTITSSCRDRPGSDANFTEALAALPQSEADLRAWLLGQYGTHIEKCPGMSFDERGRPQPMLDRWGRPHCGKKNKIHMLAVPFIPKCGKCRRNLSD